jgi:hypothetical protein
LNFSFKGLNTFKIQTKFSIVWLPEVLIQNSFGMWTPSQMESCSFSSYMFPGKDWKFLEFMKSVVSNFKILALENIWIIGESLEKV